VDPGHLHPGRQRAGLGSERLRSGRLGQGRAPPGFRRGRHSARPGPQADRIAIGASRDLNVGSGIAADHADAAPNPSRAGRIARAGRTSVGTRRASRFTATVVSGQPTGRRSASGWPVDGTGYRNAPGSR